MSIQITPGIVKPAASAVIGAVPGAIIVTLNTGEVFSLEHNLAREMGQQMARMADIFSPAIACPEWPVKAA